MRNIWKYHFSGEGVLLDSIMDIHCSKVEGGVGQYWMTIYERRGGGGGGGQNFHFAEFINK